MSKKIKFDPTCHGVIVIDFDAPMEHPPRTWYNYGGVLNCSMHLSKQILAEIYREKIGVAVQE